MTRVFNDKWSCPECGVTHYKESLFNQWLRSNKSLASENGFVFFDTDLIVHKYKTDNDRTVQYLMFVEVKTFGAMPTEAQRDTLNVVGQFLRNRNDTPSKKHYLQVPGMGNYVHSTMSNSLVRIRAFGAHLLVFERKSPLDGWIKWNKFYISVGQLEKLLRFELDPDSLQPMDNRIHHAQKQYPLFEFSKCNKHAAIN